MYIDTRNKPITSMADFYPGAIGQAIQKGFDMNFNTPDSFTYARQTGSSFNNGFTSGYLDKGAYFMRGADGFAGGYNYSSGLRSPFGCFGNMFGGEFASLGGNSSSYNYNINYNNSGCNNIFSRLFGF